MNTRKQAEPAMTGTAHSKAGTQPGTATVAQGGAGRVSRPPLAPDDPRSRPATRGPGQRRPAAEGPPGGGGRQDGGKT